MSNILRGQARALTAGSRIMWMPGGRHSVTLDRGGRAHDITVEVTPATAATIQAELEKLSGSHRPFFDFHHDEKEASAWPKAFTWSETPEPGVYADIEWSEAGLRAIEGKTYRAFSPAFYASPLMGNNTKPAKVTGAPFCMGGLVNDPAFKKISPLWAKNAAGANNHSSANKGQNMTNEEMASLQAKRTELEQNIEALRAQNQDAETLAALEQAQAEAEGIRLKIENEELRATNARHEAQEKARRKANAEQAVEDAVRRGAISSKDESLKAKWTESCTNDPEALKLLAGIKGNPAITMPRFTSNSTTRTHVDVLQDDMNDVLRAYSSERDPQKRGILYASRISKRLEELRDMPLRGTNTLGTVAGELILQRAMELLKFDLPVLSRITTDFSSEPVLYNVEINTRIVTPPAVATYNTSSGYAAQDTTTTDVPVTINAHRFTKVTFGANELGGTFRRLFDEQAEAMQYALGKDMVDALYAVITTGNYTATPVDAAVINMDRRVVIDMGTALTLAGNRLNGRTLLLNSLYYGALMSDDAIVSLGANQQAGIITGNRLPNVHGFDIIEAPNLPATGNLTGFGFTKSAMVLATRLPTDYASVFPEANGGGSVVTVTNPDTGMSVALAKYIDHVKGQASMRVAIMYGVAKGQVAAGQILRSGA